METLQATKQKLKELSEVLDGKNKIEMLLNTTEEEFIEQQSNVARPKLRPVNNLDAAEMDIAIKEASIGKVKVGNTVKFFAGIIMLGFSALVILINIFGVLSGDIGAFMYMLFMLPIVIIGYGFFSSANKARKLQKALKKQFAELRRLAKEKDEKDEAFNKNEYPKLLEAYNKEVIRLKPEYERLQKEARQVYPQIEAYLNENKNVLSEKFYDDIDQIIEILDDGRANSLSEAINIRISDKQAEELIREQMRQTEIQRESAERQEAEMKKQRQEMERHNREVERHNREVERQSENKIDYAKCHNCRHEKYCGKTFCRGYMSR